ncbi:MAG: hypothetical protein ACJ79K_02730 [Gemmatimonadaceae bacterium]
MRRRAATRPSPRARASRLTFVLPCVLAAHACASPAAIRRFSASATEVTARLPDVADAMSRSCHTTASYRLRRSAQWFGDDSVRAACIGRDSAMRSVARAGHVLADYFAALQSLAGDKVPDLDAALSSFGAGVAEAGGFDEHQVGAINALAKFAASRAADGYRRRRLRDAIVSQNENVQIVTAAIHDILDDDFGRFLANDALAQTSFYRSALTESAARDPLTAILVRDSYDEREAALAERTRAVRALAQAMLTVGRGHQALYDARDHFGGKGLLAAISTNARELDTAMKRVEKAF